MTFNILFDVSHNNHCESIFKTTKKVNLVKQNKELIDSVILSRHIDFCLKSAYIDSVPKC